MKKGNLLLVDDEPLILQNLKFTLSGLAENIFTAENGEEALRVFNTQTINCVVCDVNMPKMNGVDLLKKVRDMKLEVPFIFFTGHGSKDLMMQAATLGAFDFLDKPYFDGIEEVVARGLSVGTDGEAAVPANDFISEYQKILSLLSSEKPR